MYQAFIGNVGPWQILIIAAVALVIFGGRGKIPSLMKDMGKGITAFKKGLKEEDKDEALEDKSAEAIDKVADKVKES